MNLHEESIPNDEYEKREIIENWEDFVESLDSNRNSLLTASIADRTFEYVIENKTFNDAVLIVNNWEHPISFYNCIFKSRFVISNAIIKGRVELNSCGFESILVEFSNLNDTFIIMTSAVRHEIRLRRSTFTDIFITPNEVKVLFFGAIKFRKFGINNNTIKLYQIIAHVNACEGVLEIRGGDLHLDILGEPLDLAIVIANCSLAKLNIMEFRNTASLRIMNVRPYYELSSILFDRSYLGKAEFYNINFSLFREFRVVDTHLVDCSFINITWPNKLSENREVYRQLKYAANKQGDNLQEQKFHMLEMLAYDRSITWSNDGWTKLIIRLSHWFSNFGQSFHLPLFWLGIGHLAFLFIAIGCDAIPHLRFNLLHPNFNGAREGFYQYFKLINPLRKADDTFNGFKIIIDVLMRIWSSYMIYNIIRATRRFIK